jgi:hypothetical protein
MVKPIKVGPGYNYAMYNYVAMYNLRGGDV